MSLTSAQHRWIYLAALAFIVIGLPLSKALISIGEIALAANFLLEGHFKEKLRLLRADKSIWLFVSIFFIHAIGLLWTEDLHHGFKDLKVKLPLLIFPIVIGLSPKLRRKEFLWLVAFFASSVLIGSFVSTYKFFELRSIPDANYRDISVFTSHIRFSLMVCLAFLVLLNCAWNERKKLALRIIYIIVAIWLGVFVFILQSMTGIIAWLVSSYAMLFYTLFYTKIKWIRNVGLTALIIVPAITITYLAQQINEFYPDEKTQFSTLDKYSAGGERYSHDTTRLSLENGYYIHIYLANEELKRCWNRRSDIAYPKGKDANGNPIYSTAIRYITSKGLRKDSLGVMSLTDADIKAIESGIANARINENHPIDNRIYTIIWEFDKMLYEENPEGHSVTQRLLFWNTGWEIFEEHPFFGIGSGDIKIAFERKYEQKHPKLKESYRLHTHNQYLTIAITLGSFGFLFFITSLFWPFFTKKNARSFLYIGFAIVLCLSMLNEDTLETQVGVTVYAFFNAFFLYALTSLSPKAAKAEE